MTPGSVYQGFGDGLHSGNPQVLYITGHDSVNGHLGKTGIICYGLVFPFQMISAKAAPFTPPLNGHCKEVWAIAGLPQFSTAYADVIRLFFQGFG
jgi:hypothetical protein